MHQNRSLSSIARRPYRLHAHRTPSSTWTKTDGTRKPINHPLPPHGSDGGDDYGCHHQKSWRNVDAAKGGWIVGCCPVESYELLPGDRKRRGRMGACQMVKWD